MNFVSQPNGTMDFWFGIDEFQSCLGYSIGIRIVKDGDGILLAVESGIDDKAQLIEEIIIFTADGKINRFYGILGKFRLLR